MTLTYTRGPAYGLSTTEAELTRTLNESYFPAYLSSVFIKTQCVMRLLSLLSLATVCAALKGSRAPSLSSPLGPVINLGYAAFAGNTTSPSGVENGPVAFFGSIPYAQPPLGDLRWRAPKALNEKGIVREATDARNWGPACMQRPAVVGIGSEGNTMLCYIWASFNPDILDCLTLNVWKPTRASAGDKLPVVVYIHVCGGVGSSKLGSDLP